MRRQSRLPYELGIIALQSDANVQAIRHEGARFIAMTFRLRCVSYVYRSLILGIQASHWI